MADAIHVCVSCPLPLVWSSTCVYSYCRLVHGPVDRLITRDEAVVFLCHAFHSAFGFGVIRLPNLGQQPKYLV